MPRNFQTGDKTILANAYAYREKAAMHRQKVHVPEQRPGQVLPTLPVQDVREVANIVTDGAVTDTSCTVRSRRLAVRCLPGPETAPDNSRHLPTAIEFSDLPILSFLFSTGRPARSSSVDAMKEKLLQSVSDMCRGDPTLQVRCRGKGMRISYQSDFYDVAGIAARRDTAARKAQVEGHAPHVQFERLLRSFA